MKNLNGLAIMSLILFSGCATTESADNQVTKPTAASKLKGGDIVKIRIETTEGEIHAELYAKEAPKTVENFVMLANKKFYDGIIFHRVIPGFMVQTGDPTGTGRGGPGYQFKDEFSPKLRHDKAGVFSMANSGPNTNGSQFFITVAPTAWLDNRHSVFGQVTQGMEIVQKIVSAPRDSQDKPLKEIKMLRVEVKES
jgi:cyclophilin family peptidyl-prolyl cis-trans isomerase